MRLERDIDVVHIPFWYRIALRGSVFGIIIGGLVGLLTAGLWGLLVFALLPGLFLFRLVRFTHRRLRVRVADAFEIIEGDVSVQVPLRDVHVSEHHGRTVDLEIRFPYRGTSWRGIIARKDTPGAITSAPGTDDPSLYAQVRGTLKSE